MYTFFRVQKKFAENQKMFRSLYNTILFRISAIFSFLNVFHLSKMVPSSEYYYNIYRIMLTAIGLWPYQTPIVTQVQSVFFLSAYYFILLFQVFLDSFLFTHNAFLNDCLLYKFGKFYHTYMLQFTTFLTTTCNLEFIFKEFSYIFVTILYIIHYKCYYFNSKEVSISYSFILLAESFYI